MKIRAFVCAVALATGLALPSASSADPISTGQWYTFAFGGPGSPLTAGVGVVLGTNPPAIAAPDAPWTFTLATAMELVVLDGFLSVDQFELFNFGSSIGVTSVPTPGGTCGSNISCALADLSYSRGIFALGPGSYSITGTQLAGQGGAGFLIVREARVPEPGVLALLVVGAVAFGLRRRASKALAAP